MATYRIHFVRTDYGYIEVEAENEAEAENKYFDSDDETLTKTDQSIVEIETL